MHWAIPLLILSLPFCIIAAWYDLKFLRIPNWLSIAVFLVYVAAGPLILPLDEYGARLLIGLYVLIGGMVLYYMVPIGGGDIKFLAAIFPYVASREWVAFVLALSLTSLAGVATLKLLKALGKTPEGWKSFQGRKFPFGFSMAGALILYLGDHVIHQF